jgi:hypothetical protein
MTEDERKAFRERIQQSDLSAFSSIGSPLPGTGIYFDSKDRKTLTPAQTTYIASIFAPGAGVVDAAGQFPEFPGPDVALEDAFAGDPMPSISENIAAGGIDRYVIAPLQGLGVLGDATYAAPVVGPVLGATVGSVLKGVGALSAVPGMIGKAKKTSTGIEALKGSDATKTAIKENLDKFAKDEYGFVSPSLEALLKSAPPNLKGKQITEWLNANANKGVKPKELEYLGIDEFVATNPKATINEVVEGVSNNKVVVGRTVYGDEGSFLRFDVTEPKIDPTTGKPAVDEQILMEKSRLQSGDDFAQEEFVRFVNGRTTTRQKPFEDIDELEDFYKQGNITPEKYNKLIEDYAADVYRKNPYEMITPKGDPNITEQNIYAYGNDTEGYLIMSNGEDITNQLDPPYSRAEAQIQLQQELENMGFRNTSEGAARYKSYIDETLPGGDNYREVVFQWEEAPMLHNVQDHFQEMNQISSALIRNRKLADGKQTLHVDELQSDLHTKGSRFGYLGDENIEKTKKQINIKNEELVEKAKKIKQKFEEVIPKINTNPEDQLKIKRLLDERFEDFIKAVPGEKVRFAKYIDDFDRNILGPTNRNLFGHDILISDSDKLNDLVATVNSAVPNYPFKDDWYAMSLKQLLKDAIDEGADAISVSSSAPIKARYTDEYSKFYETLYDQKIPSAMKKLANKYSGKFEKGNLDEYDIYGSLLDDVRKGDPNAIDNVLGLQIGNSSYGERFGGGVQDIDEVLENINKLAETNIIRITPEMKKKILEEGLPSFAFGGPVFKPFSIDNIDIFNP